MLDLLVLALVFVPLERAFALAREQRVLRFGWRTDLAHFFVSHLLVQVLALLTMAPAALLFGALVAPRAAGRVAAQPLLAPGRRGGRVRGSRSSTRAPRLPRRALALALPRDPPFEPRDRLARRLAPPPGRRRGDARLGFVPLFVLGFSRARAAAYLVFVSFHAVFLHANLRFRLRALRWSVVTPAFHHWHHAEAPVDQNFAVHLPLIDRLFGTAWLPGGFPERYGIAGDPVPEGWCRQLAWPLSRRT